MKRAILSISFMLISIIIVAQQPELVSDYNSGPEDGVRSREVAYINGKIILVLQNEENGKELGVVSNGQLSLLKDLYPGEEDGDPRFLTEYNGLVYFSANDDVNGSAIWTTDGTSEGTVMVYDPGDDNDVPSYFTIANNGWMYYDYDGGIFRTDGVEHQEVFQGGSLGFNFKNASFTHCTYKNGIAFLRKNNDDSFTLFHIDEDEAVALATTIETGFFGEAFGLAKVTNGLMFTLGESDENGTYVYNEVNESLTRITIDGSFGSSRRIIDLSEDLNISWVGGQGYYILNGVIGEEERIFESSNNSAVQGEQIIQGVYNEKAAFIVSEGLFGDEYLIVSDGTTNGTLNLGEMTPYQSDIVMYENYGFIADGISNNFQPTIYQFNLETNQLTEVYDYNNNSIEIESVKPLGVRGGYLYFIYNLDQEVGSELYRIAVDLGTTSTKDVFNNTLDVAVVQNGNAVQIRDEKNRIISCEIHSTSGQLVYKSKVMSNEDFVLDLVNGPYFISMESDGKYLSKMLVIINH